MTLANSHWDYAHDAKRRSSGLHFDISFLRHFVGVFALSFSVGVWYAILHFGFHVV